MMSQVYFKSGKAGPRNDKGLQKQAFEGAQLKLGLYGAEERT